MKLQLAISTNSIDRLRLPSPVEGVGFVVSWQNHNGAPIPETCLRDDVVVVRCNRPGLSMNRNNAINSCSAPVILVADDDLLYTSDQLLGVIEAFAKRPEMDLATFKVKFPKHKQYPPEECRLHDPLPKGYSVTSMEIAFRNPLPAGLQFNPKLGLGSKELPENSTLECGEEELFIHQAIHKGLDCRFIPFEICTHPQLTTGQKTPTPGVVRGMGAVIRLIWPGTWPLRLILKAYRLSGSPSTRFFPTLGMLVKGAFLAPRVMKQ